MAVRKVSVVLIAVLAAMFAACGEEPPQVVAETEDPVEVLEPAEVVPPPMSEEEKMAFVMENCICPQCPSWVPEAEEKGEGGYCAVGTSNCIVLEAGCVCPQCPVTEVMGLEWGYYCTRGSAMEMAADQQ